jgi:hypothetical protein
MPFRFATRRETEDRCWRRAVVVKSWAARWLSAWLLATEVAAMGRRANAGQGTGECVHEVVLSQEGKAEMDEMGDAAMVNGWTLLHS